jgi:uncharacterized repeat protein (TIGR01451 family)
MKKILSIILTVTMVFSLVASFRAPVAKAAGPNGNIGNSPGIGAQMYSISGYKFNDLNENGIWDTGEPGLQGWTINLTQSVGGAVYKTATTHSDGSYSFTELLPSTYYVYEVSQADWTQTFPTNPSYYTVTVPSSRTNINFGNCQELFLPASVSIIKTPKMQTVSAGDNVSWTITINNTGGSAFTGLIVDTLPSGFKYVSDTLGIGHSISGQDITWDVSLAVGGSISFNLTAQIPLDEGPGTYTNIVAYGNFCSDTADVSVKTPTSVTIIKTPKTQTVTAGNNVSWTITINNTGASALTGPIVDTLPNGFTYVSDTLGIGHSISGQDITWNIVNFVGTSISFNLTAEIPGAMAPGTYTNAVAFGNFSRDTAEVTVNTVQNIAYVYHQNFFSGYPDKTFKPERSVSRAEVASSVGRALGLPYFDISSPTFPDVPSTFWAYGNIEEAYKEKLVIGYPNGTYGPDRFLTRAEAAMIFFRLLGLQPVYPSTPTFRDINSSYWAYGAIEAIAKAGIIVGYPDGTFRPDQHTTRAEYVTIACKSLFRRGPFKGIAMNNPYPDIKSTYWAYDYIMEASIPHAIVNPEKLDFLIVIPGKKIPIYYEGPASIVTVPEIGSTIFAVVPVDGLTPTGADPLPRNVTVKIIVKGGLP